MSLADDLGYRIETPNAGQRLVQRAASTRPGAWVFSKSLRHLDDAVLRLTGGRASAPGLLAGLPVLDVTTTGRRSGLRRTSHLIAVPIGDALALIGTNFGQPSTPAWVLNLEADPGLTIAYGGRALEATARTATAEEHAAVMAASARVYGGYLAYQQRITTRRLRVFIVDGSSGR